MAKNPANDLNYFLRIMSSDLDDLGTLRQWEHLKLGFDDEFVWVKDFDLREINSVEVKSIPSKQVFYSNENKLFPLNSLLPAGKIPSVLWTPIERALPVQLPSLNHNYFGLTQKINPGLKRSDEERAAFGMIVSIQELNRYIQSAAAIRLRDLKWIGLNYQQALIIGTPLLPINGSTLWRESDFLIPVGYDMEFPSLQKALSNLINADDRYLVIWNEEGNYFLVDKFDLQQLSISSFRLTKMNG